MMYDKCVQFTVKENYAADSQMCHEFTTLIYIRRGNNY